MRGNTARYFPPIRSDIPAYAPKHNFTHINIEKVRKPSIEARIIFSQFLHNFIQ